MSRAEMVLMGAAMLSLYRGGVMCCMEEPMAPHSGCCKLLHSVAKRGGGGR